MLIAGNAGHCIGLDPGALGSKITETELAAQYVKLINQYLEAVGIDTIYIQENSLSQICAIANDNGADLFYALHFNSADNPAATGTETFYYEGSSKGKLFAQCVQNQLVQTLGLPDRGLKTNRLYVTTNTNMPGILIEVGFINNPTEEDILINRMDDACRAIARGVTDYIVAINGGSQSSSSNNCSCNTSSEGLKPGMASKYFSLNEVTCHCCGENGVQPILLEFLDELREAVGGPVEISCAYRCPSHNAEVGGVPNSQHVLGTAADIIVGPTMTVDKLAKLCFDLGADACGYYYDQGFVHADLRYGRWSGAHITW